MYDKICVYSVMLRLLFISVYWNTTECLIYKETKYLKLFFNPLIAELNPICHLLALLGVHRFLHVSRIRVKSLTLKLLMSYTGCPTS
jgi:predicted metal-dependent peptidase